VSLCCPAWRTLSHPKWWAQFSRTEQVSQSILVKRERPRSAEILTGISGIRQCGHKPMMYILGKVDTLFGGLKYFKIFFGLAVLHCLSNWLLYMFGILGLISQYSSRVIAFRGWSQWLVAMTILNLINGIPSPQLTWRQVITRHVKSHGFGLPDNQPPRNSLTWFEVFVLEEILWCHVGGHDKNSFTHLIKQG
jgi:hypothetical protein